MSEPSAYFNTHIDLFGLITSVRPVPCGKGKSASTFIACSISAFQGPRDNPTYCTFQTKVAGRAAAQFIDDNRDAIKERRRFLIKARLSDPWIDQFTYPKDHEKAGQPGASIKTRLLKIRRVNRSEAPASYSIDINCFGYLNNIWDCPDGTEEDAGTFMACSIAALQGLKENPDYCNFQARVTERDAEHLLNRCRPAVRKKRKVLVGVRLTDPWIEHFTYADDHAKAGQPGASLKTCLSLIKWITVDKERVYSLHKETAPTQTQETPIEAASHPTNPVNGEPSDSSAPEPATTASEPASKAA